MSKVNIQEQVETPRWGAKAAGNIPIRTDASNVARFADLFGEDVRYCGPLGGWLVWDGSRWMRDEHGQVAKMALDTIATIKADADLADNTPLKKWAEQSCNQPRQQALLAMAKEMPGIRVTQGEFDRYQMLVNAPNGVLMLKDWHLLRHGSGLTRDYCLSKCAGVAVDFSAAAPRWGEFLRRVLGGKAELVRYVQKAVGYSLTGRTNEQCLFVLHGNGANGKSTFLETLREVFGDYARHTPAETIMFKVNPTGNSNDRARLKGARFVTATETDEGKRLAEGVVKEMTGGDVMSARLLYQEFFEFKPEFKLWLATNHRPEIRGTDHGIWRRIRLIPFEVTIPLEEQDKDLRTKLRAEAVGILNWAVQGCHAWLQEGLEVPQCITDATEDYRKEMDPLGLFLAEACVVGLGQRATIADLVVAYNNWAELEGREAMSPKALSQRLARDPRFERKKTAKNRYFAGLAVKGGG